MLFCVNLNVQSILNMASGSRFGCDPVLKSLNFLSLALSSDSSGVGGVIKFNQPLSTSTYPQSSTNISLSSERGGGGLGKDEKRRRSSLKGKGGKDVGSCCRNRRS